MKTQTIKPKDGETYIIESYDGEFVLIFDTPKPLNNITLQFPENPFRASKIRIQTNQDFKKVNAIGTFNEPFKSLKSGNIDFVWCPVGKEYLVTGVNIIPPIKKTEFFEWIKSRFRKILKNQV